MKIQEVLNIPASFFYHKVIDSVLYDIKAQTGETLTEDQLENYSYVKQFTKTTSARLTVTKLVPNEAYYYKTSTTQSEFNVKYDIQALSDHKIKVIYQEDIASQGFMRQMNDMLVGTIMGFVRSRNFKKMLKQIEQSY
ncbi:hypothetical protein FC15_GL000199 [Lapidilactobacillus concavus DSM 17758]|uniref:DUF3284 domain-containing protein n=1 Tax=Lapidilactobacillus concavus DSM 17758 TaxID=1423735 RepID=A0A0R1W0Q8_9LACO|nr:DUF3284 domain-containing protein [Lapidilactobacillus concavus]KRM08931.1 hypothetical protein FC15_GL000199 [Lapidilactobacillus concavus DSM 17758]GEL14036.1 hypothetical protein LCO01nite_15850 [Lapidilactobacillus concavus]